MQNGRKRGYGGLGTEWLDCCYRRGEGMKRPSSCTLGYKSSSEKLEGRVNATIHHFAG